MFKYNLSDVSLILESQEISHRFEPNDGIIRQQDVDIMLFDVNNQYSPDDFVKVGSMAIGVVDRGLAYNENESLFEACSFCQTYSELERTLFRRSGEFRERVFTAIGYPISCLGIMFIESLQIDEKYRGAKLGLAALHTLMRFGCMGCSTIFLKAHPFIQSNNGEGYDYKKERIALRKYYARLGFQRLGQTDYMGANLDDILPVPPEWMSS